VNSTHNKEKIYEYPHKCPKVFFLKVFSQIQAEKKEMSNYLRKK